MYDFFNNTTAGKGIIVIVLAFAIFGLRRFIQNQQERAVEPTGWDKDNRATVRVTKGGAVVGLLLIIVSAGLAAAMSVMKNRSINSMVITYVFAAAAVAMGAALLLTAKNFRIELHRGASSFEYTTVFGNSYTVMYSQCRSYSTRSGYVLLVTDERKYYIETQAVNVGLFIGELEEHGVEKL